MPRKSKADFTTEKGVRSALSSLAKTMTSYSRTFTTDDDRVIAEQMVQGVRDALGANYKKVPFNDGTRTKLRAVRDKDVFDIVFKTEEKVDSNGKNYTVYKLGDKSDDFDKVIRDTIKVAKKGETKSVMDRVAYENAARENAKTGAYTDPGDYTRTAKVLSKVENAYSHIDTLTDVKRDISEELRNGWIDRDKTMSKPEQVKAIMVQRAKDAKDAELSDIDKAFKTVSDAIKIGEMEGLEALIWHDGRQATMSDIEEILDAAKRL